MRVPRQVTRVNHNIIHDTHLFEEGKMNSSGSGGDSYSQESSQVHLITEDTKALASPFEMTRSNLDNIQCHS